ncbi:hypothetical protein PG994_006848 [Apiospora phragmitis]|uniref:Uncharacterized protein n=1 Tax=Apiospora phragmitis TaxID=2905665 RepID=A0ABR1VGA2_9PEZI
MQRSRQAAAAVDGDVQDFVNDCVDKKSTLLHIFNQIRQRDKMRWHLPALKGEAGPDGTLQQRSLADELKPIAPHLVEEEVEIKNAAGDKVLDKYTDVAWDKTLTDAASHISAEDMDRSRDYYRNYGTQPGSVEKLHE